MLLFVIKHDPAFRDQLGNFFSPGINYINSGFVSQERNQCLVININT